MKSAILKMVMGDAAISQTIAEAAIESPDELWTELEIHENVADALGLDLDLNDKELFADLLKYYNGNQTAKSGHVSLAFEITDEDVDWAINSHSSKAITMDDAAKIKEQLDNSLVEKAALYGNDIDQQTQYAHKEIYRQWCLLTNTPMIEVFHARKLGSCAVSGETFDLLASEFHGFKSTEVENEMFLDCTAFDSTEGAYNKLASIIGNVGANDCKGSYVLFFVE